MRRKAYHVPKQRLARSHGGATSLRDCVRRLALRCGLLEQGQRATVEPLGGAVWMLTVQATGRQWRIDMTVQDYEEVA